MRRFRRRAPTRRTCCCSATRTSRSPNMSDGLYIMNPGSLNGSSGTYGTLDITPAGIVTNIVQI